MKHQLLYFKNSWSPFFVFVFVFHVVRKSLVCISQILRPSGTEKSAIRLKLYFALHLEYCTQVRRFKKKLSRHHFLFFYFLFLFCLNACYKWRYLAIKLFFSISMICYSERSLIRFGWLVGWLVGWVLWHINHCMLFNAKSILFI